MLWEGSTRDECEQRMKKQPTSYHVECEILSRKYCVSRSDETVALSFLLKIQDIITHRGDKFTWKKESLVTYVK